MGQKLLIKLVNLGGPPVPTGPPASNKGIWGGAGVVSAPPPKILELHYSATGFQHCAGKYWLVLGLTRPFGRFRTYIFSDNLKPLDHFIL